jgi:sirohydrochlorin ferrochelatase
MNPSLMSLLALACMVSGILVGMFLPGHRLTEDTKDVVRLGVGLVSTMAALVLSLLIASAKSTYDTESNEIKALTAEIILIDLLLTHYGHETDGVRILLRRNIDALADQIWSEQSAEAVRAEPFGANAAAEAILTAIQDLQPRGEAQHMLQIRATQSFTDSAKTRLLLFAQRDNAIPSPFLAVLVFWLTIIFASFGLFARPNLIALVALFVFALSAAGAIFLILELNRPFGGFMSIASEPLRHALAPLGR